AAVVPPPGGPSRFVEVLCAGRVVGPRSGVVGCAGVTGSGPWVDDAVLIGGSIPVDRPRARLGVADRARGTTGGCGGPRIGVRVGVLAVGVERVVPQVARELGDRLVLGEVADRGVERCRRVLCDEPRLLERQLPRSEGGDRGWQLA